MFKELTIQSQRNTYTVSMMTSLDQLVKELSTIQNGYMVVDQQIAQVYPAFIEGLRTIGKVLCIEATEEKKTLAGCELVLNFLQEQNATKSATIIAIGGGITQDIASFVAHIYYRGLNFIFVPTTLLAMSDSCIGGKCGLNYFGYKNQIGAFHSPDKVLIFDGFTQTLTDEAIYSGYGEIFKQMIIGNEKLYSDLCLTLQHEGFRNASIADHIFKTLEIKKRFIEEDEFDVGCRRILNYGHTFGHAIELATHYAIPHGLAVTYGLDLANFIAWKKGLLSKTIYQTIHQFIQRYFPQTLTQHDIKAFDLITNAQRDKKISNGKLNMIFLENYGEFVIEPILLADGFEAILNDYLVNECSVED